jgi:peptidoglycan-N-acetylglucosamine deacetylase
MKRVYRRVIFLFPTIFLLIAHAFGTLNPGDFYAVGPRNVKRIALTFDDGPGPDTEKFLSLLNQTNIKATFFLLGELVENRPAVAKKIVEMGHEVGSHTFTHINYKARYKAVLADTMAQGGSEATALSRVKDELRVDMKKTREAIKKATGVEVHICRMPNGIDRPWIKEVAKESGVTLVNWTYGTDWNPGTYEDLLPGYLSALKPGTIFLFHDGGKNRAKSLALTEAVIKAAQEKGFEIVTITQLLDSR